MGEKIGQYNVTFSEITTRRDIFIKCSETKLLKLKDKFIADGFNADIAEKFLRF